MTTQPSQQDGEGLREAIARLTTFKPDDGFWIFRRNRDVALVHGDIYTDAPFKVVQASSNGAEGAHGSIAMSCCATDEQIAAYVADQSAVPPQLDAFMEKNPLPVPDAMRSTKAMRDRVRELSHSEYGTQDDYERAVIAITDDLEGLLSSAPVPSPDGAGEVETELTRLMDEAWPDGHRAMARKILSRFALSPSGTGAVRGDREAADIARCLRIIETAYDFRYAELPLKNCGEWKYLKRLLSLPSAPVSQIELRKLVDVVWNEATESTAVPSTKWADKLIARVFPPLPDAPSPKGNADA